MYFNKVIIVGRLARNPEAYQLPSGSQVVHATIAYNRNYKDRNNQWKEETHYFEIKAFGKLAQRLIENFRKGDLIIVEGRLSQDKWLDSQSGQPVSKVRIVALDIKLIMKGRQAIEPTTPPPKEEEELEELPSWEELENLLEEENKSPKKENKKEENKKDEEEDFFDDEDLIL